MTRLSRWAGSVVVFATAAAITAVSGAGSAADRDKQEHNEGRPVRAGNGPGPGPNGPGPGCNVIPPLASTGAKVDISEFPPADSLTDPELAGPVQLLRSGTFDIPIQALTSVNIVANTPRGTITLPLFKERSRRRRA